MRKKLRRRLVDEEIGEEAFMPTSSIPIQIGKKEAQNIQDWFTPSKNGSKMTSEYTV